jgi:hypothetical protein
MKTKLQIPNLLDDLRKIILSTLGEEQREERGTEKIQTKERSDKLEKRKNCRYCPPLCEQNDGLQVCKVGNTQLPTALKETLQSLCRKLVTFSFCFRVDLRHKNIAQLAT